MTITEFLLARIEEDETVAQRNTGDRGVTDDGSFPDYRTYFDDDTAAADEYLEHFNPRRSLAECAAKRAIVAAHPVIVQLWWEEQCEIEVCETCQEDSYPDRWPCPTITALAAAYKDHPDYRQEWEL